MEYSTILLNYDTVNLGVVGEGHCSFRGKEAVSLDKILEKGFVKDLFRQQLSYILLIVPKFVGES